jgi:site-specific recombinase XerD
LAEIQVNTQIIKESVMLDDFAGESCSVINLIDGTQKEIVTSNVINPYLRAATSENTRRAYQNDIAHFVSWGGVLPTSPDIIIRYLQDYATQLNPRTLVRRLTAIKHWHTYQNFSDPTNYPLVRKTLTGIMHVHGKPRERAPALTVEHLTQMAQFMRQQDTLIMWRNHAILQVGFFGAFRVSELINIHLEHITFVPEGMEILIPRSKTDPEGEGQYCAVPYGDDLLCPVVALKTWCEKANIDKGVIFREVDRHQNIGITPLTSKAISMLIKTVANRCQLPDANQYSSHSMRRGFATAASRQGAPFVSIMRHGRWRHEGTVLGYIEEGQRFETNAAKVILQKEKSNNLP